jgi:hypothetical protein
MTLDKSRLLAAFTLATSSLIIGSVSLAAEPTSYLLLCKAGNNTVTFESRMDNITGSVRVTSTWVKFNFRKSDRPASGGIDAGSCAWPDRGMRANEASIIDMYFPQVWVTTTVSKSAKNSTVRYSVQGGGAGKADIQNFISAYEQGKEFQVRVYGSGDTLRMTKYGP